MLGITAHQQLCLAWEDDLGAAVTPQDPRGWAGGAAAIPPCRAPAQGSLDRTSPGPIALLPAASLCKYPAGLSRILLIRKKSTPRKEIHPHPPLLRKPQQCRERYQGHSGPAARPSRSREMFLPVPVAESSHSSPVLGGTKPLSSALTGDKLEVVWSQAL